MGKAGQGEKFSEDKGSRGVQLEFTWSLTPPGALEHEWDLLIVSSQPQPLGARGTVECDLPGILRQGTLTPCGPGEAAHTDF